MQNRERARVLAVAGSEGIVSFASPEKSSRLNGPPLSWLVLYRSRSSLHRAATPPTKGT